jgi:hypothetical protein
VTTKLHTRRLVTELCVLPAQDSTLFGISAQEIRDILGKSINRYAASDDHARRMVDWLLFERPPDQRRFRPTPGEIREASEVIPPHDPGQLENRQVCQICNGAGAIIRGLITWCEEMLDGSIKRRQRVLGSEQEAVRQAAEMPAEAQAQGLSCAVDCRCRKRVAA